MSAHRGYLTLAVEHARFLEMAVDMALSLRPHTEHPIAIAADEALAARCREVYDGVFDAVAVIPERFLGGRTRKFGVAEACPWEEAIFVDADCIVLKPLDHLWAELEDSDLSMLGRQLSRVHDETHHGFSSRWLMDRFALDSYMKTNSGLFCFRRSAALEIMEECLRCFHQEAKPRLRRQVALGRWLGDEIVFGIVGGRRGLQTLRDPLVMYWPDELDSIDLAAPTKPLLHLIWPPPAAVVDALLESVGTRRREAGLPGGSERHWHDEVRSLRSMARRRRLLERIGLY